MGRLLNLLGASVAVSTLAVAPAVAVDPLYPSYGDARIDVEHYDLDLDVEAPSFAIDAKATLKITALKSFDAFTLDLNRLDVASVKVDGVDAKFEQKNDKLVIRPKETIERADRFKLVVRYSGKPQAIDDPTEKNPKYKLGWRSQKDGIYVVGQPTGASTFFPSNEVPDDKATFRIAITAPAGYSAVSNGLLAAAIDSGRKRKRYVWKMDRPMQPVLATVHIGKYNLDRSRTQSGKPLRFYTSLSTKREDRQAYRQSRAMLLFFEKVIGEYPFDNYGTIDVDDPTYYAALETQTISSFPRGDAGQGVIAHELAHQWFGDSVSIKKWEDIWIAEGAATYFELLWKNRESVGAFEGAMARLYRYVDRKQLGPSVIETPLKLFSDRVYSRGSLSYYALRQRVGDDTFYRILRTFLTRYRDANASSQDFIDVAREVSGDAGVEPILRAWLYDKAVPELAGVAKARPTEAMETPDIVGLQCGKHRRASSECEPESRP